MPLMTKDEFLAYASEMTSQDSLEFIYEYISEHNGECARFGDSWPGALVRIHGMVSQANSIERQYARLQNRPPRDFRFAVRHPR